MKILIVDDDKSSLTLCAAIFKDEATKQIADSREALDAFQKIKPDVVLLDCRMPYIDGFELSRQMRMIDNNCKIVMITAAISEEKNYSNYCNAFFLKPFSPKQLKETVNNLALLPH